MKHFMEAIKENVMIFDGSKGYMLQKEGLKGGKSAEVWNITNKDKVRELYQKYKDAGSNVIQTNTFQATEYHLKKHGYADKTYEINYITAKTAKEIMGEDGYVAASIGPLGRMMQPSGDLTFSEAYDLFKYQISALIDGGVDAVNFETFTDVAELRAAVIAAKECNKDIPVLASVAFEENKRTLMGTTPYNAGLILKTLGCDMVGTNCSFGPGHMVDIVEQMSKIGGIHLTVKPNAGMPKMQDGNVYYDESPKAFAKMSKKFADFGATLIGGCCGTTPLFVTELKKELSGIKPAKLKKDDTADKISSMTNVIKIKNYSEIEKVVLDATLGTEYEQTLKRNEDMELMTLAMDIGEKEGDVIEVNVDADDSFEKIANSINTMQGYIKKPFVFNIKQKELLDKVLRIYRGRAGVISKDDNIKKIANKYGAKLI